MSRGRAASDDLAGRFRRLREDLYGEHGGPMLAESLGIPFRSWREIEGGAAPPPRILLRLIAVTGVHPEWLLSGRGPMLAGEGRHA